MCNLHFTCMLSMRTLFPLIITFFYINKRKYWLRKNIRLLVFDGFTRFRYLVHDFTVSGMCACDKTFVASEARRTNL